MGCTLVIVLSRLKSWTKLKKPFFCKFSSGIWLIHERQSLLGYLTQPSMNTNDHKMIGLQFTSLATKQKARADMKIRQPASQQNAPTPLCGVRRWRFSPSRFGTKPNSFHLPGNCRGRDMCKIRGGRKKRGLQNERYQWKGFFSPKKPMTHPIMRPDSLQLGYIQSLATSFVTVVTMNWGYGTLLK